MSCAVLYINYLVWGVSVLWFVVVFKKLSVPLVNMNFILDGFKYLISVAKCLLIMYTIVMF